MKLNLQGLPELSPTERLAQALGGLVEHVQASSQQPVQAAEAARASVEERQRPREAMGAALDAFVQRAGAEPAPKLAAAADGGRAIARAGAAPGQPVPASLSPLGPTAAIEALTARVTALHEEIGALEAANAAKSAAVHQLIAQIDARKAEIERARENKRMIGIFGALLGAPAVAAVSLVQMYEDDGRLRSLNASLATAQAERAQLEAKLASHQATRAAIQRELGALEQAQVKLEHALAAEPPAANTPGFVKVAAAAGSLERARKLEANLREQVRLLERLRDSASAIGGELDQLIAGLKGQLAEATQMAAEAERSLFELIKVVTAKDPQAAAEKWLGKKVSKMTEKLMSELGLSMKGFIRDLVKEAFPGQERSAAAQLLQRELEKSLLGPAAEPTAPALG